MKKLMEMCPHTYKAEMLPQPDVIKVLPTFSSTLARVPHAVEAKQRRWVDADQWTRFSRPVAKWHICS